MSLAENLLNELDSPSAVAVTAEDAQEPHIVVGANRQIVVPEKLKLIAVTGDKDIETVTIDCIRYWDGHDLSQFAIYINYTLPNAIKGTYIPQIKSVQENTFTFDWTIGRALTSNSGALEFLVLARDTDADGTIIRQWSSLPNSECAIARGNDIVDFSEDADEQIDILSQIIKSATDATNRANKAADDAITGAYLTASGDLILEQGDGAGLNLGKVVGSSVSVQSVSESTQSGGTNVVTFTDGKKINIKNGKDYVLTSADETAIADIVLANLPYAEGLKA